MTKREREQVWKVMERLKFMKENTAGPSYVLEYLQMCIRDLCVAVGHQDEYLTKFDSSAIHADRHPG